MRYALPLLVAALVLLLPACKSGEKAESRPDDTAMGAMNDTCPVSGESFDRSNPPAEVSYEGQTIGFCCPGCIKTWNDWDDTHKSEYVGSLN